jgi:predicted nuclease of restriction endonuclease-like (RecB) superfamily
MPKKATKKTVKKVSNPVDTGLSFESVVASVSHLHTEFLRQATKAVNVSLTLRNWLIGAYIHEYELRGADRAKYGENLIEELSRRLQALKLDGCERSQLTRCRQFYRYYPQIGATLPHILPQICATPSHKSQTLTIKGVVKDQIFQSLTGKSGKNANEIDKEDVPRHTGQEIVEKLSYSHIVQLLAIDDPYQRAFYEMESIKGNWSIRELKRQISTMYFERTALSTNKAKLREIVKKKSECYEPKMIIRDPMIFEFLDIKPSEAMLEGELEQRMLDRLQETLLELGHGFCFEARQKRLLIGKEHFFVDLVFYHRVLKCHVLIELKNDEFKHEYIGQLNTYLTWYTKNVKAEGDQPPVGILLCTGKDETLIEYALAGMSNNLFVSRYLAQLPTKEELLRITRGE